MESKLGMQYIMDGNGNYYRVNNEGQLVIADDRDDASVFTVYEANQRIGSGKKAKFYHTISVEEMEDAENMMTGDPSLSKIISFFNKASGGENLKTLAEKEMEELAAEEEKNISDKEKKNISEEEMNKLSEDEMNPLAVDEMTVSAENFAERIISNADHTTESWEKEILVNEIPEKNEMIKEAPLYEYGSEDVDWLEFTNYFCYVAESAGGRKDELSKAQSEVEKELCDLLHYIELYDLTDEECLRATRLMKDARHRRRDIKNEIAYIDIFKKTLGISTNVSKAKSCIKELKKMENRTYHPREMKELFKGMKGRETVRTKEDASDILQEESLSEEEYYEETDMEYVKKETLLDKKENNWVEMAKQQYEFFSNIRQYMINLEIELDDLDREIEDILTKIEDANYNVAQGYKVFKELKDLRTERREKEKELFCLQAMTEGFNCENMAETYRYSIQEMEDIIGKN